MICSVGFINKFKIIGTSSDILNNENIHRAMNHPVHIVDKDNVYSPSAFIPFCSFGGNFSIMGVQNEDFTVPLCNSFEPRVLYDQRCYEIDLNRYKDYYSVSTLQEGLVLYIDSNADRSTLEGEKPFSIHVHTIGNPQIKYHDNLL